MTNTQFTDISAHKLFDVLQKEYLICILREKIYPKQKHKDYWHKIAEMKRDKINDLKWKHKLISIFDDERIFKDYKLKTYNEYGLPNFYYPNERVKEQQIYWDIMNYFEPGSTILFIDVFNSYKLVEASILKVIIKDERLIVAKDDLSMTTLNFNEVSRKINIIV